jgi:hypothetical protein
MTSFVRLLWLTGAGLPCLPLVLLSPLRAQIVDHVPSEILGRWIPREAGGGGARPRDATCSASFLDLVGSRDSLLLGAEDGHCDFFSLHVHMNESTPGIHRRLIIISGKTRCASGDEPPDKTTNSEVITYTRTESEESLYLLGDAGWTSYIRCSQERGKPGDAYPSVETFIRDFYLTTRLDDPVYIRRIFSDPVETYWGKRNVPLKDVIAEKVEYFRKWPRRQYRVMEGSVRISPSSDRADVFLAHFDYEFFSENGARRSSGLAQAELTLKQVGREFIILSENGRVLRRD